MNGELIRLGSGRQYAFNNQNYRYRAAFEDMEHTAHDRHAGLWGACD
ncbi:hypothetical protein [Gordonia sp. MP11Mi]